MSESRLAESFLAENSYCVLAFGDKEGRPHTSMMHFAVGENPISDIYFATNPASRKAAAVSEGPIAGSLVVGSGDVWKTLQMDGVLIKLTDSKNREVARAALYAKYPEDKYHEVPDAVFMHFRATWYRYTDFTTEPPIILPWSVSETVPQIVNPD